MLAKDIKTSIHADKQIFKHYLQHYCAITVFAEVQSQLEFYHNHELNYLFVYQMS